MLAIKIIYILNIIVAGQISISALSNPVRAADTTFGGAYHSTEVIRLVGCFWLAITVLSILGLWKPITFSPVLLLQFIYKGTFLLVSVLPAIQAGRAYPVGMAAFFVVWVVALPFVMPWRVWLAS